MQKFDVNKEGFAPVGKVESINDFNRDYTDFSVARHNADTSSHSDIRSEIALLGEKIDAIMKKDDNTDEILNTIEEADEISE